MMFHPKRCHCLISIVVQSLIGVFKQANILLQILTKDSVTVFVNAIMYYKVNHAEEL